MMGKREGEIFSELLKLLNSENRFIFKYLE
jgi:hypothetical protein